jgi:flavin reductase (DIM6/NTAB) family NADH-FMN oxidoreductase RutF
VQCKVRSFHDEGDHALWVGEVIALATQPGRPLVYHAGAYRKLAENARGGGKGGGDRV